MNFIVNRHNLFTFPAKILIACENRDMSSNAPDRVCLRASFFAEESAINHVDSFWTFFTPSSFVDRGPFYYIIAWACKFRSSIVRQIICKYHFITKNSELWGVHKVNKIFISACPHGLRMTPKLKWNIVVSHRSTKYLTKITVVRPNRVVKCQFF